MFKDIVGNGDAVLYFCGILTKLCHRYVICTSGNCVNFWLFGGVEHNMSLVMIVEVNVYHNVWYVLCKQWNKKGFSWKDYSVFVLFFHIYLFLEQYFSYVATEVIIIDNMWTGIHHFSYS